MPQDGRMRTAVGLRRCAALLAVAGFGAVSCTPATSGQPTALPTHSSAPQTTGSPSTTPSTPHTSSSPPPDPVQKVFASMSEAARVGQLFMVDCPTVGMTDATRAAITQYHVGAVILDGTTTQGMATTQSVTAQLRALAPRSVGLLISTDQEGGYVQRLQGSGFDTIPSQLAQGQLAPATLQADATVWAGQLKMAGVNVNLAPVLDTVPAGFGPNPPIGDLDREFGHDPATVTTHGNAVVRAYLGAGVDPTVKHFPGLGRVTGNTDTTSGVTDYVTTRNDAYLAPFAAAVRIGAPFVMMSTAIYAKIDPGVPAAFSRTIVTGMLRGDLGFHGVIISDDLGQAAQVGGYGVGQRAVDFLSSGGTMVLTVDGTQAGTMTAAVLAKAQSDPRFKAMVDADALIVLTTKRHLGLVG
jgi:beta-N-acetylhexosaminidase